MSSTSETSANGGRYWYWLQISTIAIRFPPIITNFSNCHMYLNWRNVMKNCIIHLIKTLKIVKKCQNHQKSNEYLYVFLTYILGRKQQKLIIIPKWHFLKKNWNFLSLSPISVHYTLIYIRVDKTDICYNNQYLWLSPI